MSIKKGIQLHFYWRPLPFPKRLKFWIQILIPPKSLDYVTSVDLWSDMFTISSDHDSAQYDVVSLAASAGNHTFIPFILELCARSLTKSDIEQSANDANIFNHKVNI